MCVCWVCMLGVYLYPCKPSLRSCVCIFICMYTRALLVCRHIMSVLLETTIGDIVIDLEIDRLPQICRYFISQCILKKFNNIKVSKIDSGFIVVFGEEGVQGGLDDSCPIETHEKVKHSKFGTVGIVDGGRSFYITLRDGPISHLDTPNRRIIGYVEDGLEILKTLNTIICDLNNRPFNNIRVRHSIVIDGDDWWKGEVPDSPLEIVDEFFRSVDDEEDERVLQEREKEAIANAQEVELELMGDIPSAYVRPPSNVLFVCQLNAVTESEDLRVVFSRFGVVKNCDVIRDYKTNDSLQYAFVEFETDEACNKAYVAMQNVMIDDKRIKVDFSQSVSKVWNQFNTQKKSTRTSRSRSPRGKR